MLLFMVNNERDMREDGKSYVACEAVFNLIKCNDVKLVIWPQVWMKHSHLELHYLLYSGVCSMFGFFFVFLSCPVG